jgi:hypothetical protein
VVTTSSHPSISQTASSSPTQPIITSNFAF